MEMPTSCISCLLNFGEKRPEYGLTIYCPYSDGVISWRDKAFDNGRLASCGIVPVPTPHGRLIDADALGITLEKLAADKWNQKAAPVNWAYAFEECLEMVDNAPTIIEQNFIEAEEGE